MAHKNKTHFGIIAKSKKDEKDEIITLNKHTINVFEQMDEIVTINEITGLRRLLMLLTALLHDLGKVLPDFQKTMFKKLDLPYDNQFKEAVYDFKMPHNYFSLFFINKSKLLGFIKERNKESESIFSSEDLLKMVLNAVAFHHWRESSIGMLLSSIDEIKWLSEDDFVKMEANLKLEMADITLDDVKLTDFIQFDKGLYKYLDNGGTIIETGMITPPYFLAFLPERIMQATEITNESTFLLGNLMRADHFASAVEGVETDEKVETESLSEEFIYKKLEEYSKEKDWTPPFENSWQYNELKKSGNERKNVILLAPTGAGKTEFAYMFAQGKKMVFSLPLKAAVNSVYDRSKGLFGEENCTVLHSDAQLMLYQKFSKKQETINEDTMGMIRTITNVSKQLGYPVQICTGDQIFPVALKYPGYERIFCVLSSSCLIIDEIQAYDPRAIAIIVTLIREAIIMGGNVLLMTATLPEFLKDDLKKAFGLTNLEKMLEDKRNKKEEGETFETDTDFKDVLINKYEDKAFGEIEKHHIVFENKMIEDDIEEICSLMLAGKRVIVLRNKVRNAQETYRKILNFLNESDSKKVSLLHSKFTQNDRKEKEKAVMKEFENSKDAEPKGRILVSTQIVEASLNIDADYLFTDIAPADALIQRMGRVYRRFRSGKNVPEEPNIIVYCGKKGKKEHTKLLYGGVYLEDIIKATIKAFESKLKENGHVLNEKMKAEIVKVVYFKENLKKSYYPKYKQTLELLEHGYTADSKQEAQKLFRDIFQIPIIPMADFETVENELASGVINDYMNFREKIAGKYIVNVSPYSVNFEKLKRSASEKYQFEFYYSPEYVYDNTVGLERKVSKNENAEDDKKEDSDLADSFI